MSTDLPFSFVMLVLIVVVGLAPTLGAAAAELPRTIVWSTQLAGGAATPVPYPTAGGPDSVVCAGGKDVVRLGGKGQVIFTYDMGDYLGGMAACADIDGDGQTEIAAATVRGHVAALTGEGKAKWTYDTGHPFGDFANVVLAGKSGGGCDVLIGGKDGYLVCLDGKGKPRWTFRVARPGHISSPAAGDINGDGRIEYVCGIDAERVLAISDDGHLLWEFAGPEEFGREVAVIADADQNGKPEVYILKAGATSAVFCLDGASGKLHWMVPIPSKCYCSLSVADINGDGFGEVLAGTKYNDVIAYSHTGRTLWQRRLGGTGIYSGPAVGDIDGDGKLEIVTSVRQADIDGNSLFVLDAGGNVLGAYPQEGEGECAEVIADIDGDGLLEVMSRSRDKVWAYRFGNPRQAGKVLWPCARGNAALTGCQLRLPQGPPTRVEAAAARAAALLPRKIEGILGDTVLTGAWTVDTPAAGCLEVTLTDPGGDRLTQAFRTAADRQSVEIVLPFGRGGKYTITARLLDTAQGRVLAQESRQYDYQPLAAEGQMVAAALKKSAAAHASLPATALAAAELERRRAGLDAALATLKARLAAVPPGERTPQLLLTDAAALRAQAAREEQFADFARRVAASTPDLQFVAWQDADPWDYADPRDELPQAAPAAVAFAAWAYGSQKEDFCLNLVGLAPEPFEVRVEPADLVGPGGAKAPWEKHLQLLQVVWMPTTLHSTPVPDMLPEMNTGRTVQVAPGSFAQVWLVVDTKDLAPGAWAVNLHLQSLTMAAGAVDVNLNLEVLPVALPYPYPWKMCNWAWPTSFAEPLRGRIIDNLVSHGSNVIYAPTPSNTCDAQGNLTGTVDWSDLDALVARAKPGDPFLFFGSLPLSGPAGMPQDSPIWKQAHKAWMREFVAHLASIGVDRRHFAFYPVDEPGNSGHTGIEQLIAAAKVLREADPQAPIYADPAGGAYTIEWIKELDPWVDVWAPASGLSSRPEFHEVISTRNRQVWMYDAPGNVRMLDTLGFYRRQPWSALKNGARGSGFWVYYQSNLWDVGPTKEPDYGTVYIDRDTVVDSRRWRAAHDGVQDVTAVLLLDDAIAQAQEAGVESGLRAEVETTRDKVVAEVTAGEEDNQLSWELLQQGRKQIADALVGLRRAIAVKQVK